MCDHIYIILSIEKEARRQMYSMIARMALFVMILVSTDALAAVPMKGDPAPDFTLKSVDGREVRLSDFRGSVVVLGLFHICNPCMNQAIEIQKIINRGEKGVVAIGVNTSGDTRADIVQYLSGFREKITFPYLVDPERVVNRLYMQRFMPTVIIIDKNGIIRYRGSTTPADALLQEIKKIETM